MSRCKQCKSPHITGQCPVYKQPFCSRECQVGYHLDRIEYGGKRPRAETEAEPEGKFAFYINGNRREPLEDINVWSPQSKLVENITNDGVQQIHLDNVDENAVNNLITIVHVLSRPARELQEGDPAWNVFTFSNDPNEEQIERAVMSKLYEDEVAPMTMDSLNMFISILQLASYMEILSESVINKIVRRIYGFMRTAARNPLLGNNWLENVIRLENDDPKWHLFLQLNRLTKDEKSLILQKCQTLHEIFLFCHYYPEIFAELLTNPTFKDTMVNRFAYTDFLPIKFKQFKKNLLA